MATRTVRVRICDVCKSEEGVRRFGIVPQDEGKKTLDLCRTHAEPIRSLLGSLEKPKRGRRKATAA